MTYLIDTNVLLRLVTASDPQHELVCQAIETLLRKG